MALSGQVETGGYSFGSNGTRTVILKWTGKQDRDKNQTTISWEAVGGGTYTGDPVVCELRVTIDGDVVFYRDATSGNKTNCKIGQVLASGQKVITHNNDGSRRVAMKIEAGIYTWAINKDGSAAFDLDQIPRASTIGASDANIGAKSTIIVTRKSSAYTHSIAYKFGSLSGYVTADGGISTGEVKFDTTSVSWTIPTTFYAQIKNAKSGACTLTIRTYSGSTQIGDAQTCTLTVTAPQAACAPSVSGTVIDSNATTKALTGDKSKLVRYYSTALCTITATAKNSATISEKKIGGAAVSGDTRSIQNVEQNTVSFYAKDSRGYEATANVGFTLIPYVLLTNNSSGQRTDPTSGNAKLTIKGDFFNGSFGAVENVLSVKYRIAPAGGSYGDYVDVEPAKNGNSYSATVPLSGLDYESEYTIQIVAADKLASVTKTVTIRRGIPIYDWGKHDFAFHVPVYVDGNLLASKRNVSASAYAEMAKGAVHNLKESIILKHPVFATLAFQAAVGRVSGSSGNKEVTFANITNNASGGLYINLAWFKLPDDGLSMTLYETKRITLKDGAVTVETGLSFYFGEVYLIY